MAPFPPSSFAASPPPPTTVTYAYEPDRNLLTGITNQVRKTDLPGNAANKNSNSLLPTPNSSIPVISRYDYHNDNLGRRTQITQTGLAFQQMSTGENRIEVACNSRSEVIGTIVKNQQDEILLQQSFAFDAIGNRKKQTTVDGGQKTVTTSYQTNALNQYTEIKQGRSGGTDSNSQLLAPNSFSPTHDPDGNLLEDAANRYTWNAENRLIRVEPKDNKTRTEYTYDYQGRRTLKKTYSLKPAASGPPPADSPSTVIYIYDGWNLLAEIKNRRDGSADSNSSGSNAPDSNSSLLSSNSSFYYTWGRDLSGTLQGAGGVGGLLAISESITSESTSPDPEARSRTPDSNSSLLPSNSFNNRFPIYDSNGNIGQMIAEDSSVKAAYHYSAFGSVTATFGEEADENPWRFSTKPVEANTGWSYYGFRYYDAQMGRWASRDPIEERGGLNLYGFLGNDGVGAVDALGFSNVFEDYTIKEGSFISPVNWGGGPQQEFELAYLLKQELRCTNEGGVGERAPTIEYASWFDKAFEFGISRLSVDYFGAGIDAVKSLTISDYQGVDLTNVSCQNDGSGWCRKYSAELELTEGFVIGVNKAAGKNGAVNYISLPLTHNTIINAEWTVCCCLDCPEERDPAYDGAFVATISGVQVSGSTTFGIFGSVRPVPWWERFLDNLPADMWYGSGVGGF